MSCYYAESGNVAAVSSSNQTGLGLTSIAGLRPSVYEFEIGPESAPNATDCSCVATLQLNTAAGTSTSVTPTPLDPGYQAAKCSAGSAHTIEPTYTTVVWGPYGINQRASYRWVAAPGSEITIVGTASNGIGMQIKSSNYTGKEDIIFLHRE